MEITDAAVEKLKKIMEQQGKGGCLRVFMAEGCCGPSVTMDLVEKTEKDDSEIVRDGLKLYVSADAGAQTAKAVLDCDLNGDIVMTGLPAHGHGCGDGGCGCGDGGCDCGH